MSSDVPNVFAKRITPARRWNDLSLPDDLTAQLRRIPTEFAQNRAGLTALFTGPSGTGKTLASEAIAGELNLELFRINLSSVISKHIGETEKNLNTVFSEAGRSDAILSSMRPMRFSLTDQTSKMRTTATRTSRSITC